MKTVLHALIGLPALVGFMFAVEALPVDNNLGIESGNNDRSLSLEGITVKQPNGNLGAPHDANGERALGGGVGRDGRGQRGLFTVNFTKRTAGGDGDIIINESGSSLNANGWEGSGDIFINGDCNSLSTNGRGFNGGGSAAHTRAGNVRGGNGGHTAERDADPRPPSGRGSIIFGGGKNNSINTNGGGINGKDGAAYASGYGTVAVGGTGSGALGRSSDGHGDIIFNGTNNSINTNGGGINGGGGAAHAGSGHVQAGNGHKVKRDTLAGDPDCPPGGLAPPGGVSGTTNGAAGGNGVCGGAGALLTILLIVVFHFQFSSYPYVD